MRITATVSVPLKMCIRDRAETVSYQVEYTTDDTMYEGESRVIQEGANGEIVTTWSIAVSYTHLKTVAGDCVGI